ncbi:hypothetical protein [Nocardia sp. NPDC047654]|uniref:hypothetical protein n=1 Tax=Nocardia sp. NPDC047654 TaxID=3364314 RepID=UPI003722BA94
MFTKSVLAGALFLPLLTTATAPAAVAVSDSPRCAMFCEDQQKRPPRECVMLCDQPAPPADSNGCRLFCELGKRPDAEGVA